MTSTFERIYQTDPSREISIERENGCIELSDQELLARNGVKIAADYVKLNRELIILRKKDAKSKSKSPGKAAKKVHSKPNKTAMARIQKEL